MFLKQNTTWNPVSVRIASLTIFLWNHYLQLRLCKNRYSQPQNYVILLKKNSNYIIFLIFLKQCELRTLKKNYL